jgi:thiamine pyrophosphate-dependent acetolactate synthase large subunit-like protein
MHNQSAPTNPARKPLTIAVITRDAGFFSATLAAAADVASGEIAVDADLPHPAVRDEAHPLYVEALGKARRYLDRSGQALALTVVQADSLERAAEKLTALPAAGPLGVLHVDAASTGLEGDPGLEERLEAFYARLASASVAALRSPYAAVVHRRVPPWSAGAHVLPDRYLQRVLAPETPWLLRAEQLCSLVDFIERTLENKRNHKSALRDLDTTLGDEVVRFLSDRGASDWLLFYYTGSSVSPLIAHVERAAGERGVLALRGPNEHALGCGALASHLLHRRPFLIVVGTAMMDEFRGTLANLRAAGARGFIICPEADLGSWFTFQGTITGDEDMREVLAGKRVPHVYLDRPETMADRLEEAFRLFESGRGPVVLLVTSSVIEARDPLPRRPAYPPPASPASAELSPAQEDPLSRAVAILNGERSRVLWQCGRLDDEERELVLAIAERAGVALVDTLGHPGAVPSYRGGRRVENYLGLLGLYGFNQRSYAFLHTGGRLNPRAEQCLFFIKSKVGQRATMFTPSRRSGLRMVQVTHRADHVAPDVEIALVMEATDFLRRVLERLDVDPEVLRFRSEAIHAASPAGDDLASRLPSVPMSPNYFFRELGQLVERMIVEDGYAYTGVYDVGRCSVSAARSVPRTGPGFAGWYGRALMGDAPMAAPTLAITEPGHVVAFVGDGTRTLVADPVPAFIENALAHPGRVDKNITVFYFSNGTFSGIRTYRERLSSKWGGRQMRVLDLLAPETEQGFGPLTVVRRTLSTFDSGFLRDALLTRRRLNVFTVLLGHNNDDDGFSLVSAGWQR